MKLAFVCNLNLARSQTLASIFAEQNPDFDISSYGIIAEDEHPLPQSILDIHQKWGFMPHSNSAKNLFSNWEKISSNDVIIAMTSIIAEEIVNLGFKRLLINLEDSAKLMGINLVDPRLMSRFRMEFELAKYIAVTHFALRANSIISSNLILRSVIPKDESCIQRAITQALSERGSVVILADFVASHNSMLKAIQVQVVHFDLRRDDLKKPELTEDARPLILVPRHSEINPINIYLSRVWERFLLGLESESLTLITPPMRGPLGLMPESYLASLYSTEISVVS